MSELTSHPTDSALSPSPEPAAPGSPKPSEANGVAAPSRESSSASVHPTPGKAPEKKWLVAVLYYGAVDREHQRCVERLKAHPYVYDVLELAGCPYIDQGRSLIATSVLDDESLGGLLFLDHDMVFDAKEAIRLIEAAEATQGIVGAAYSMRRPGKIIGGVDVTKLPEGFQVVFFEGGGVLPASYLGMGTTAIPRSVLVRLVGESEKLYARQQVLLAAARSWIELAYRQSILTDPSAAREEAHALLDELVRDHLLFKRLPRLTTGISDAPCVPFFSHLQKPDLQAAPQEGFYFGEDVSFCIRSHEAEIGVFLDTRARVYHKGAYCYGLEDVGMEVPFCHRLEVLQAADPKTRAGIPNRSVSDAIAARQGRDIRDLLVQEDDESDSTPTLPSLSLSTPAPSSELAQTGAQP